MRHERNAELCSDWHARRPALLASVYDRPVPQPGSADLLNMIPQMVWTAGPDGAVDYVNDRVVRYFGASESAMYGAGWLTWVHPDDRERATSEWARSVRQSERFESSVRLLRASDSSWRWHLICVEPVADDQGRVFRWCGTCTDIDEQKQFEAELLRQRHLFDTALTHSPDFTYTFDLTGRFTYINAALLALWHKTLPEALSKNFFDLEYPDALAERLQWQIQEVIETKAPLRDQTAFTGANGETGHYEYIFVPVLGKDGGVEAVAGSTRDITERTRSAEALRTSEERLRFALDAGDGIGTWDWDVQNDRVYANARFAEFYSVEPQRAQAGEPIASFLHAVSPEDRDSLNELIQAALRTGKDFTAEYRLIRKDDSIRWVNARGRCRLDENGSAARFVGVVFDITDRKRAELLSAEKATIAALGAEVGSVLTQCSNLRESLQQCAVAMVNHLDVAIARIWTLAPTEDVLQLVASAGLYTHIDGAHARIPVGSFKIGRIAQERAPHLTNDVANDPWISDAAWARREGMVAFAGYPLVVESRLIGVLGLFSRHKLGPDALMALESVSATIAIAIERNRSQQELVEFARELQRSNEDLEQFAQVASHDLRSPLNNVMQFTQLMMRRHAGALDRDMTELLTIILNSGQRMADLIAALLNYSRLNYASTNELRPVSSLAAYGDAVENLRTAIEEAGAILEREELPEVLSNFSQLTQVFQNLISNAMQYRGEAIPRIKISAQRQDNFWRFSVADNGPGIAAEYHSMIFEPFKRLHGNDRPGSGIGLAFCRKFVERQGGRIWVDSEAEKGATFYFTLPAIEKASVAATERE